MNDKPAQSGDNNRALAILGDPTLRLHSVAPPTGLRAQSFGNYTQLFWNAGEEGCRFQVYKAESIEGPFARLNSAPLNGGYYLDRTRGAGQKVYMVRALKSQPTGCGSYVNLSQGQFIMVEPE
jgi:hypothetical protein